MNPNHNNILERVDDLVAAGRDAEAISLLDLQIKESPTADLIYQRGRLKWRLGLKGEAMSDYARAAELDPESPAKEALEMARQIMAFYNKDLYNP